MLIAMLLAKMRATPLITLIYAGDDAGGYATTMLPRCVVARFDD